MSQQHPHPAASDDQPSGDPWQAFGYIVSGVAVYGLLGWFADRWLETNFLVAVGILVGAGFGIYMTFARFRALPTQSPPQTPTQTSDEQD